MLECRLDHHMFLFSHSSNSSFSACMMPVHMLYRSYSSPALLKVSTNNTI